VRFVIAHPYDSMEHDNGEICQHLITSGMISDSSLILGAISLVHVAGKATANTGGACLSLMTKASIALSKLNPRYSVF